MEVQEDGMQLGWEGDDGFGELLLERVLEGSVTVLFEPAELLDAAEVDLLRSSPGGVLTVFDADGEPRCNIRTVDVFETTWGDPDPRLVAGDGFGTDVEAWRRANRQVLREALSEADVELTGETALLVQQIDVVDRA